MGTPSLIGLAGYKGSGKTTAADHLVSALGYKRIPLAEVLKDMLVTFGLTNEQVRGDQKEVPLDILCGKTSRWAMQSLGTEWGRNCLGGDVWVRAWWAKVQRWRKMYPCKPVIVDDVRFKNEFDFIYTVGGHVIEVCRPGCEPGEHASEKLPFEAVNLIDNTGTVESLQQGIEEMVREVGMILGLDLSATRTGYALLTPDGGLESYGSWRFPKKGHPGSRWIRFRDVLRRLHDVEAFTSIAYEKVMPNVQTGRGKRNAPVGQVYGALLGVVESFACRAGEIPLVPVHIATAKKTAGHGRYKKQEMIDAAKARWNLAIVNEDEADAMWVAETARRMAA